MSQWLDANTCWPAEEFEGHTVEAYFRASDTADVGLITGTLLKMDELDESDSEGEIPEGHHLRLPLWHVVSPAYEVPWHMVTSFRFTGMTVEVPHVPI